MAQKLGCTITEAKESIDTEEFELHWRTFLVSGFDDWVPLAVVASGMLTKVRPREILQMMISLWLQPTDQLQSEDQMLGNVMAVFKTSVKSANIRRIPIDDPYWKSIGLAD